jgi:uncharacterized protein YecE (DUF72 family)
MGLRIGTCGYSYDEWKGVFYPEKTPKGEFLRFYAREFDTVELNVTFYRLPPLKTLESIAGKVPEGFSFVVKAPQALTHVRGKDAEAVAPLFQEALKPFSGAGKLGGVLLQFPFSFKASPESRGYVEGLAEGIPGTPVVVEFRHSSWFTDDGYAWLKGKGLSLCCVDEPSLPNLPPPVAMVTGPVGYVRFHGRNKASWYSGSGRPGPGTGPAPMANETARDGRYITHGGSAAGERYRYLYKEEELKDWVPKLAGMAREGGIVFGFFNNHPEGYAVRNAQDLRGLMKGVS